MGYAKGFRGRNHATSLSKRQQSQKQREKRYAHGNPSLSPPIQICQTFLWTPQEHIGHTQEWISVCAQGLDAQLLFLQREQPWLLSRKPCQIAAIEQYNSSYSWKEELSFPKYHLLFDHPTSASPTIAQYSFTQERTSQSSRQIEEWHRFPEPPHISLLEPMTPREKEILHFLASGFSNQEIAQQLVIAVSTVKWHLKQIYGKLGVTSRTQAIVKAREHALVP